MDVEEASRSLCSIDRDMRTVFVAREMVMGNAD